MYKKTNVMLIFYLLNIHIDSIIDMHFTYFFQIIIRPEFESKTGGISNFNTGICLLPVIQYL